MLKNFIHRPGGAKEVMIVAGPMIISSLSWTVMTFMDRVMLRWVSGDAMTAAFQANLVWFSIVCFPLGICIYANTFVGQYFGDRQYQQIGRAVWQAIWLALLFVPLILIFVPLAGPIFESLGHSEAVTSQEIIYFQALCFGAGGMLVSQSASAFFSGRGQTSVVMIVDCVFALLNLFLNWLLIFGNLGFPAWGIFGAGFTTALVLWSKSLTYIGLMLLPRYRQEFGTIHWRPDWRLFQRMMKFGLPNGTQIFLDVIGFTIFVMLLGRLGAVEAQASSMAFSISSFAFMPVMGLGTTVLILVGQRLGENRPDLAERSTWTALLLGLGYMFLISLFYWISPDIFLAGFFAFGGAGEAASSEEPSRVLAGTLLKFVAAYNLFDASFMIMSSAIKGAGDTMFVMWTSFVMAIILAVITYLVVEVYQLGVMTCWVLVTIWICGFGLIFLLRFLAGNWKSMRVIEMQHPI